ncbi:MAG TPA: GNAT family N-acetyltransferase, partial [Caulobacteraceae bacterium]|nr:GNAT family N-acetyltransferase [Caulobacteraceae bacterium]
MIETDRLILRGWRDEDYQPFAALNADPEVMRHFPATLTRAESDAFADRNRRHIEEHGWGLWAVERKSDGLFVGYVGLMRPIA